jgi:hypothetical protein
MNKILFLLLVIVGFIKAQDTTSISFSDLPVKTRIDSAYNLLVQSPSLAYQITWKNLQRSLDFKQLPHIAGVIPSDKFAITQTRSGHDTTKYITASEMFNSLLSDSLVVAGIGTVAAYIMDSLNAKDGRLYSALALKASASQVSRVSDSVRTAYSAITLEAGYRHAGDSVLTASISLKVSAGQVYSLLKVLPDSIIFSSNHIALLGSSFLGEDGNGIGFSGNGMNFLNFSANIGGISWGYDNLDHLKIINITGGDGGNSYVNIGADHVYIKGINVASFVTGTPWTSMGYVTGTPWTSMGYQTASDVNSLISAWIAANLATTTIQYKNWSNSNASTTVYAP